MDEEEINNVPDPDPTNYDLVYEIQPDTVEVVPQQPNNMRYYAIYNVSNGEIMMVVGSLGGMAEDELAVNTLPGQDWTEIPAPPVTVPPTPVQPPTRETHYVLNGIVVPRRLFTQDFAWSKTIIVANNIDTAAIGPGLPVPTRVSLSPKSDATRFLGQQMDITDGAFSFTSAIPGEYEITLDGFPYLPYTQTITAA